MLVGQMLAILKNIVYPIVPAPLWKLVRPLWARYSFGTFKAHTICHKYGAHNFQMHLVDFDGAKWYDHDWDSLPELTLLRAHGLKPGAIAFNAGSNQGLMAMMLAKAVEPDGFVVGIEPNHRNVQAARRNAELNQFKNLTFIEAAASNSPGHVMITETMNAHVVVEAQQLGVRRVEAVSIDELSKQYGAPQVLYIDVEGFECRVLEGARETLRVHTPDCFVEVHVNLGLEEFGGSISQVLSFFPPSRYQLLINKSNYGVFRPLNPTGVFHPFNELALPRRRFFLVALARV